VYLRARWYAPGVGIFTAPDPWEGDPLLPISLHPYAYANNNPANYLDPTGRQPLEWILARLRDQAEACYNAGDFQCLWNCYWLLAFGGYSLGYRHAALHMFQFLYKWGDLEYSYQNPDAHFWPDWIRYSPSVQKKKPEIEREILGLIHQEARNGSWSGDVETVKHSIRPDRGEVDLYYAMNVFLLWAEADYGIEGCYEVEVRAVYRFRDTYDWHPGLPAGGGVPVLGDFPDEWSAALERAGLAQSFEIRGSWKEPRKRYLFLADWLTQEPMPPPILVQVERR